MPRLEGRIKLRHFTDCTKTVHDVLSRWSPSKCLTYKLQFYDWAKEVLKEARQIFRTSNQQKTINKLFSSFAFVSFRAQSLFLSFFRVFDISKKISFFRQNLILFFCRFLFILRNVTSDEVKVAIFLVNTIFLECQFCDMINMEVSLFTCKNWLAASRSWMTCSVLTHCCSCLIIGACIQ